MNHSQSNIPAPRKSAYTDPCRSSWAAVRPSGGGRCVLRPAQSRSRTVRRRRNFSAVCFCNGRVATGNRPSFLISDTRDFGVSLWLQRRAWHSSVGGKTIRKFLGIPHRTVNLDDAKPRICSIVPKGKGICLKAPSDTERLMTPTILVGA